MLPILGPLVCILYAAVFSTAVKDINQQQSEVNSITYDVTGDAKGATVASGPLATASCAGF